MKKLLSIPLLMLLLFSGVTVNLAVHLCGGSVAARTISLSGKSAGCGMDENEYKSQVTVFRNHCCENITSSYTLSNNYTPASYQVFSHDQQYTLLNLAPADDIMYTGSFNQVKFNNTGPPGNYSPNGVEIEEICIFRI